MLTATRFKTQIFSSANHFVLENVAILLMYVGMVEVRVEKGLGKHLGK